MLESYDWDRLRTYDEVIDELNGKEKPSGNPLIAQAQKHGG